METTENDDYRTLSESLQLTFNSKGFGWRITILSTDVKRLAEINDKLVEKYGEANELIKNREGKKR